MKTSTKCKTEQLIGKFLYKEDVTENVLGYNFVSLSLSDFKNGKCKIDDEDENIILDCFLSEKERKFLNSLQEGEIVTYSVKFPQTPRYLPDGYVIQYLIENGTKYWNFRHYKDKTE